MPNIGGSVQRVLENLMKVRKETKITGIARKESSMTDKEKIREEVEKLKSQLLRGACSSQVAMETRCKEEAYNEVLAILNTMQEEPVSEKKCMFTKDSYTDEDRKVLCDDCKEKCEYNKKEEPVSEDLEEAIDTYLKSYWGGEKEKQEWPFLKKMAIYFAEWQKQKDSIPVSGELEEASLEYFKQALKDGDKTKLDAFKAGAKWQKEKDSILAKDLEELISTLSKRYPEVSFAKLSRIAVMVAKWQKQHLWKPADGDDLPEIDREVIAILDNGKVGFAHRPPEYWDGKNIVTGKVTRHYPKTYDKDGWNIPNVKYWLDCLMQKEIEL